VSETYQDAALVLIGHGSTLNAASKAPTYQHADLLRGRGIFAEVREAFWKQEPLIATVVSGVSAPRVFLVPLFISEGYFSEEVIPRELGFSQPGQKEFQRVQRRGGQTLYYCRPVGTHQSMTSVLLARAREIVEKHPFPRLPGPAETSLFIAGHGTGQNENSRQVIERQAALIREKHEYRDVHAIYMEEEPRIGDCYVLAQTNHIIVVPFFISDGLHSSEDIPVMLGESETVVRRRVTEGRPAWRNPTEKRGKLVWFTPSIGSDPHLPDVILERVREGAGWE
jgi:sirohydrochlorin cobaltochelatase